MSKEPDVIPPGSRVRLVRATKKTPEWKKIIGTVFRIGYYSRQDGLDYVWLVNSEGEYEQACETEDIHQFFQIEWLSSETDFYGDDRPPLGPLRSEGE